MTERATDYGRSATLKTGRAIRRLCALLLVGLAETAHANAKVAYASAGALLATERVDAVVAGDTALVKGEFVFFSEPFYDRGKQSAEETLPIVERSRRESEGLSITAQADRPIHSEGKGPGSCVVLGDRKLRFLPAHLGMIVVSTKPAADRGGKH